MKKTIKYFPPKSGDKFGEIIIRMKIIDTDPKIWNLTRHCCDTSLGNCKVATSGENCADSGGVEVWM